MKVKGHVRSLDSNNKCTVGTFIDSIFPAMHPCILRTHQFSVYQGHTDSLPDRSPYTSTWIFSRTLKAWLSAAIRQYELLGEPAESCPGPQRVRVQGPFSPETGFRSSIVPWFFILTRMVDPLNSGMGVYTTSVWCRIAVTEYETQDRANFKDQWSLPAQGPGLVAPGYVYLLTTGGLLSVSNQLG